MRLRNLSLGVIGLGAIMFLFAVVMWVGNKPDFSSRVASNCRMLGSPGSRGYEECYQSASKTANEVESAYNSCLFSSRYLVCQGVIVLPYLSIAGIMILLAGGGLFAFGMMQRTAKA